MAAALEDLTEGEGIILLSTPFGGSTPRDQKEMTNQRQWSQNTKRSSKMPST